jgi:hypothetical protein
MSSQISKANLKKVFANILFACGFLLILWFVFIQLYTITGTRQTIPTVGSQMAIISVGVLFCIVAWIFFQWEKQSNYQI